MQNAENAIKKSRILLAVPSKDRVETLLKYTWPWLHQLPFDFVIFVEPQDEEKYSKYFGNHLYVLDKNDQGLGYAKQEIKRYAERSNYDLIFKIDDDIKCFTNFRERLSPFECCNFMIKIITQFCEAFFRYPYLGAIAFPYAHEMYEQKMWENTKRLQTCYIVRTSEMLEDSELHVFEDFAQGLSLLLNNYKIMKCCLTGIECGVKVGEGTGGHQSKVFDRSAHAVKELDILRRMYPPLGFKKVDKAWEIEPDISTIDL